MKQSARIKESATPFPEAQYSNPEYQLSLEPMIAKVDDKDVYVVTISSKSGSEVKEYFDVNTGLKLKKESTTTAGPSTTTYSDYREVDGIKFPYSETISSQVDIPLKVTDVKINSGLTDADFK